MSSLLLAGICSIPLILMGAAYIITCAIQDHNERKTLHAIFDGDRMQAEHAWRSHKHSKYGNYTFEQYEVERRYY